MSGDDYLFDKSGKPDPEVERLERLLSPLAYRPNETPRVRVHEPERASPAAMFLAVAAALLLAVGTSTWLLRRGEHRDLAAPAGPAGPIGGPSFVVASLAGRPRIDDSAFDSSARLGLGTWLTTDDGARASITVADIGHVEVDEGSKIRLVETSKNRHQLELAHGSIRAKVDAPPRLFVIGTPDAKAVDLGCAYTLRVDPLTGEGMLHVTSGWVSLEAPKRASMVPKGASCLTRKGKGPGTPFFDDAAPEWIEALRRLDFEGSSEALDLILAGARKKDTLSLWHLLSRVHGSARQRVLRRLVALVPLPSTLDERNVLALDRPTLDAFRRELEAHW